MPLLNRLKQFSDICTDSREIKPGNLFVALPSYTKGPSEIKKHIEQAIAKGATAVIGPEEFKINSVPYYCPLNLQKELSQIATAYYPKQPETIIAVTGTNGKTSVAHFSYQLWSMLGLNAATTGTIGTFSKLNSELFATHSFTTPTPILLHKLLNIMAENNVTHLSLEASSHGLDQHRMDGVKISAAAFTNLTHDHLDYHPSMDGYLLSKARLFKEILPVGKTAIININNNYGRQLRSICQDRGNPVFTLGHTDCDFKIIEHVPTHAGQTLRVEIFGKPYDLNLKLIGDFQAMNALTAAGLVIATGADIEQTIALLEQLESVPGRMQYIGTAKSGGSVYVDYAHTPDALDTTLKTIRPHCTGKIYVVFGCGGDRDHEKRPTMGSIAAKHADFTVVTDDNPRGEDPASIRKDIMYSCPNAYEIGDRKKAIQFAVEKLTHGDVLLIAGKGHETTQTYHDRVESFVDADVAREFI